MRVLICDRFDIDALAMLKGNKGLDVSVASDQSAGNLLGVSPTELKQTHALIIRSRLKVSRELLGEMPELKVIVTATSGFDHIDLKETQARGIKVMHTPDANAASACELTIGLAFACARKLVDAHRAVKTGAWRREPLVGQELCGKTWGIVGLGRIGSRVAVVAQALGMKTIAFDPYRDSFPANVTRMALDELLKLADVVSFHVPATSETRTMLNAARFAEMNHGALIINTSRGSVISERDLLEALNNGWVAGAGLDVFEREPLARDSKLNTFSNVVLSPHLGAAPNEAFFAASREAAEKILAFARDGSVSDPLPPLNAPWFELGFN
jgi:D-3-phosphoglycerate dehydrogenase